jgi:UDP:flavonoid glycosyltransferase YjiC (YdhE family)
VFLIDAYASHTYASFGIARRLQRAGFAVEMWGGPLVTTLAASQGFAVRVIDGLIGRSPQKLYHRTWRPWDLPAFARREARARQAFRVQLPDALARVERALREALHVVKPQVAVFDPFMTAYWPLFWAAGVRGTTLCATPLAFDDPAVPPFTSAHVPRSDGSDRRAIEALWLTQRARRFTSKLAGNAASKLGLYTHDDLVSALSERASFPLAARRHERNLPFDLHFNDMAEWVLFSPAMELPRHVPLPARVRFLGPCVDDDRQESAAPWQGKASRIYVSVGTVEQRAQGNVRFLRNVIDAFRDARDVELVVSCGSEAVCAALGDVPAHISLRAMQPQLAALRDATLAISHGGPGTFRECVVQGVPVLAYPRNHDQFGTAARIAFHGVGLSGRRRLATARSIRELARTVLEDRSYGMRMQAMRAASLHHEQSLDLQMLVSRTP